MSIGIYKIENLSNHKIYIGQSIHIEKRWLEHCRSSNQNKSLISKAIFVEGKTNFSFSILEECKPEELDSKEQFYIKKYNSITPNGYNITSGGWTQNENFSKYNKITLLSIISDIKNTSLSFKEIAQKYGLDISMIYYLNRGEYHTQPNEKYPLRIVKDMSKQHNFCIDCGIEIGLQATRCSKCDHIRQQTCERPSRDVLKDMIRTMPFTEIGKQYSVRDNSIRKWCKAYNLPFRKKDINSYSDESWLKI